MGGDEKGDGDKKIGNQVWGKRWTRRTVAGYLFKGEIQEEMEKLIKDDDYTYMTAYQPALTNIWNGLSEEEQGQCDDQAKKWNTGAWPRDKQIE